MDVDIGAGKADYGDSATLLVDAEMSFHRDPNGELDTELVEKDGLVYISRYVTDDAENANFERYFAVKPTVMTLPQGGSSYHSLEFDKVGRIDSF